MANQQLEAPTQRREPPDRAEALLESLTAADPTAATGAGRRKTKKDPLDPASYEDERRALMAALEGRQTGAIDVEVDLHQYGLESPNPSGTSGQAPENSTPAPSTDVSRTGTASTETGSTATRTAESPGTATAGTPGSTSTDALSSERAALEARAAELARREQTFQAEQKRHREELANLELAGSRATIGADEYERAARDYENEGDEGMARHAREKAQEIRQAEKNVRARAQDAKLKQAQARNDSEAVSRFPELRDQNSELAKEVMGIFKTRPSLAAEPDGLMIAAVHADALRGGRRAKALEAELAQTKAALAERDRILQPGTGQPSGSSTPESWENLPMDQQREMIRRQIQTADEQGVRLL